MWLNQATLGLVAFGLLICRVSSQSIYLYNPNGPLPQRVQGQVISRRLPNAQQRRFMANEGRRVVFPPPTAPPFTVRPTQRSPVRVSIPVPPEIPYQDVSPVRTRNPTPQTQRRPLFPPPTFISKLSSVDIDRLANEAIRQVNTEDRIMRQRLNNGIDKYGKDFDSPDPLLFSESPERATHISRPSRIINWIARILKQHYPGNSLISALSHPSMRRYPVNCPFKLQQPFCDTIAKYRTVDGQCNNLDNPLWGSAFVPFRRLIPAKYATVSGRDDSPRSVGQSGLELPNARIISTRFHEPSLQTGDDSIFSMMLTLMGQFVSHDMTDRAPTKGMDDAVMKCCNQDIKTPRGFCFNIPIPQRDFFRQYNRDCLEFPRSLEVTDLDCKLGTREQLNQASSYIDGGAIYGATKNKSDSLRRFRGGLLMMSVPQQLPIIPHGNTRATMQGFAFYAAGDNRVNEFIGLIGMETLWAREHNRIATALGGINTHWTDETLYQEARRIIIAIIQHITFAEYLPAVLGPDLIRKYDLQLLAGERFRGYDRRVDSGLANVFATVAMRFGHSMLRTTYTLLNRDFKDNGYPQIDLEDTFFRPQTFLLHEDPLMRGFATNASKLCDRVLSGSAINTLYQTERGNGGDLAAANVQRGRDHGLPEYVVWRRFFGLSVPYSFSTSSFIDHDQATVSGLQSVYRNPTDVDLFSAGLSEKPVEYGAVGPLFGNIIASQFKSLREGDRYWYETGTHPQAFSDNQLAEIRKVTMSRLLCNAYSFDVIQPRVFYNPNPFSNAMVSCARLSEVDLNAWRSL